MTQEQAVAVLEKYLEGLDESVGGEGFGREHEDAYSLIINALMAYRKPEEYTMRDKLKEQMANGEEP